jgi:hypothetical protein
MDFYNNFPCWYAQRRLACGGEETANRALNDFVSEVIKALFGILT